MKIRSLTCFTNPGWPLNQEKLQHLAEFAATSRSAIQSAGYDVQTCRLTTPPFSTIFSATKLNQVVRFAKALEQTASELNFEYVSIGPATPSKPESYRVIVPVLTETQAVFVTGMMTNRQGVNLPAVRACAEIIHQAAQISPDGFANLQFAALSNVRPGSPFFPSAYHHGSGTAIALAVEGADLAVQAFSQANDLASARVELIDQIEKNAKLLESAVSPLCKTHGIEFLGIDFTLAPFPKFEQSIGTALEALGLPAFGLHGSLTVSTILTSTLDQAKFHRTGFNGLMLPILEDASLAQRASEGFLNLTDLLAFSAVCGTGLDTIPLPGNTSIEELYAILLDTAALACRLNKPLTARLMPIPGKAAGEMTDFSFPYFANCRILPVHAQPLEGFLAGGNTIAIRSRKG